MPVVAVNPQEIFQQLQAVMFDSFHTTPAEVTDAIRDFCANMSNPPIYVPVEEDRSAQFDDCYNVVASRVRKDGGKVAYGWCIWEWPTMFIEAEHHGVWERPDGKLVDLARKRNGERRILFVPDPLSPFTGSRIPSARRALNDGIEPNEFCKTSKEIEVLIGPEVGEIKLVGSAAAQYRQMEVYRGYLQLEMRKKTPRDLVTKARVVARTTMEPHG